MNNSLIILSVFFIATFALRAYNEYCDHEGAYISNALKQAGFISACFAGVVFFVGLLLHLFLLHDIATSAGGAEIASLSRESSMEGRFMLGSGYVNGAMHYYYFVKDNDGSYGLGSVKTNSVRIVESDSVTPHILYELDFESSWLERFARGVNFGLWEPRSKYMHTYKITVPKGSIIQEYRP